jgi:hypothetical protein
MTSAVKIPRASRAFELMAVSPRIFVVLFYGGLQRCDQHHARKTGPVQLISTALLVSWLGSGPQSNLAVLPTADQIACGSRHARPKISGLATPRSHHCCFPEQLPIPDPRHSNFPLDSPALPR